jgi:ferritin-like metal-binding protein YciE
MGSGAAMDRAQLARALCTGRESLTRLRRVELNSAQNIPNQLEGDKQHMKIFSANIADLRTLYVSNLKKALDMEQKITHALPDIIENSTDAELSSAFRTHLQETKGHVTKIEGLLARNAGGTGTKTCKAIDGLTTEASDTIKDVTDRSIRDMALIGAAQQVEHHEIAVYGTLRRWAEILDLPEDASVIESIEDEENHADKLLTEIAKGVNSKVAA